MFKVFLFFLFSFFPSFLFSQIILTIEGTVVVDTTTGISNGINIPREQRTLFTYRNNSVSSANSAGYMLQAGDEIPQITNNNLDGGLITGNSFTWNGTNADSWTHALFTGYNLNVVIKYNYLLNTPNGIQRKSNGMTDESGVIAYNIIKNPRVGIVVKGMNGVKIFNNTFYSDKTSAHTPRGLIDIHSNTDRGLNAVSTGSKIFNNIFYTRNQIPNIKIYEPECLRDFESDYNVFWCESGEPLFEIGGRKLTFAEWQAMGFDKHSVVLDPVFEDFDKFVPLERLDYGINLGSFFQAGLSVSARWGTTDPETTFQSSIWQAGARIHDLSGPELTLYPNPAVDEFNVVIRDSVRYYNTIKLYDLSGKIVLTDLIYMGVNSIKIPRSLPAGIYQVTLESDHLRRYTRKLIVVGRK
ncbi:MAG TPA: T9SS type A sorting domain-containing protein [Bacteroidales bacterium]|jgi:hypothetical protein|nr:T9SS type A sorting domain-containing protein [Bacteroidales bacterium]HQJ82077.1 T9SS type A sorting domain-containing protein [Bacteroidales bacterium]